jgi:regulator of cell morphogenesis and NO signaling
MTDRSADVPPETGALIGHILTRSRDTHRADLASLVPMAERVGRVHEADPDAPRGLAGALATLAQEMEDHMAKEEMILFPATRAGAPSPGRRPRFAPRPVTIGIALLAARPTTILPHPMRSRRTIS